jgi:hypothetical protein
MIEIPEGLFTMGTDGGEDEAPQQIIHLDGFEIAKYPGVGRCGDQRPVCMNELRPRIGGCHISRRLWRTSRAALTDVISFNITSYLSNLGRAFPMP